MKLSECTIVVPNRGGHVELRYALRSWAKHLPHSNIVIAGDPPEWCDTHKVATIRKASRYQDSTANLIAALEHEQCRDTVIWLADDIFAMRPQSQITYHHRGLTLRDYASRLRSRYRRQTSYNRALVAAHEYLRKRRHETLCYELHLPVVFPRGNLLNVLNGLPPDVAKRSVACNVLKVGGTVSKDVKITSNREIGEVDWLSSSSQSFRAHRIGRTIRGQFREPCRYEVNQ